MAIVDHFAPEGAIGPLQIIPNRGPHEQIYVEKQTLKDLVLFGLVKYEPDYGPNANVYRPINAADTEEVRSWIVTDEEEE